LASGFYSKQNIKTPVKIGALAMLVNSILCALMVYPLKHAGLALASSLAGYFNAFCLFYLLRKKEIYHVQAGWSKFLMQLVFANLVMGLYLFFVKGDISYWYHLKMGLRLLILMGHVAVAVLIYLIGLLITGFKWRQFRGLGGA
jgi:putative peptidoglycan lipid II flippase